MEYGSFATRTGDIQTFESGADHLARAVVDTTGKLVGLSLKPQLLRQPCGESKQPRRKVPKAPERVLTQRYGQNFPHRCVRGHSQGHRG
jgi:hypothetical protein